MGFVGDVDPRILGSVSGKFRLLIRMLPILKAGNHKVISN